MSVLSLVGSLDDAATHVKAQVALPRPPREPRNSNQPEPDAQSPEEHGKHESKPPEGDARKLGKLVVGGGGAEGEKMDGDGAELEGREAPKAGGAWSVRQMNM